MKQVVCVLGTMMVCGALEARELTWCGGAEGEFAAASNWTDETGVNYAPQPGDVLTIGTSAKLTGSFDLGADGVTIKYGGNDITSNVEFSGSGRVSLNGTKKFRFNVDSAHTGGLVVRSGTAEINKLGVGSGPIDVYAGAGGQISLSSATIGGENAPIRIYGSKNDTPSINIANASYINGRIEGDSDIYIVNAWGALEIKQGITVPAGKTVYFASNSLAADGNRIVSIYGEIDANFAFFRGIGAQVRIFGTSQNEANAVTLGSDSATTLGGYVSFESSARWAGSLVSLNGANLRLKLASPLNFSRNPQIALKNGAKIAIAHPAFGCAGEVAVDGTVQPAGEYSQSAHPEIVEGNGILLVGAQYSPAEWIGSDSGLWSDGANWSGGSAPREGQLAVFANGTGEREIALEAEQFDFGSGGIALYVDSKVVLRQKVSFAGAGGYIKYGRGKIVYSVAGTYAGQTVIADGSAVAGTSGELTFWGVNPVVKAVASPGGDLPYFEFGTWGMKLPYTFRFEGKMNSPTSHRINITNNGDVQGGIEADEDVYIRSAWGPIFVNGKISAPGKTVTYYEGDEGKDFIGQFRGEVDASVVKKGAGNLALFGVSPNPANRLQADEGLLRLTDAARWGGLAVGVGASGVLDLKNSANLSTGAMVEVAAGGKIRVAAGEKVIVGGMSVAGVPLARGKYSRLELPNVIEGDGRIQVGIGGMLILIR